MSFFCPPMSAPPYAACSARPHLHQRNVLFAQSNCVTLRVRYFSPVTATNLSHLFYQVLDLPPRVMRDAKFASDNYLSNTFPLFLNVFTGYTLDTISSAASHGHQRHCKLSLTTISVAHTAHLFAAAFPSVNVRTMFQLMSELFLPQVRREGLLKDVNDHMSIVMVCCCPHPAACSSALPCLHV
jgi:hypothetical protein